MYVCDYDDTNNDDDGFNTNVDISGNVRRHSNDWRHLAYRAVIPLYHPSPLQSYWTTETFRIDCK